MYMEGAKRPLSTLMRLGLLSTLICWVFSLKMHQFENALESGSKQKCINTDTHVHIIFVWMVKNIRKHIKMKTMTTNITGRCVCSKCCASYCAILLFSNMLVWTVKRIKTVVWTQIDQWAYNDNQNAYFWERISVGMA